MYCDRFVFTTLIIIDYIIIKQKSVSVILDLENRVFLCNSSKIIIVSTILFLNVGMLPFLSTYETPNDVRTVA